MKLREELQLLPSGEKVAPLPTFLMSVKRSDEAGIRWLLGLGNRERIVLVSS